MILNVNDDFIHRVKRGITVPIMFACAITLTPNLNNIRKEHQTVWRNPVTKVDVKSHFPDILLQLWNDMKDKNLIFVSSLNFKNTSLNLKSKNCSVVKLNLALNSHLIEQTCLIYK